MRICDHCERKETAIQLYQVKVEHEGKHIEKRFLDLCSRCEDHLHHKIIEALNPPPQSKPKPKPAK